MVEQVDIFIVMLRQLDVLESVVKGAPPLSPGSRTKLRETGARFGQIVEVYAERGSEVIVGDKFSNIGAGATIVNRSTLNNSFNTVKESYGPDMAQALQQLAELVEKSGNMDAADNFNALTEELQRPQPKKSLLKSFWSGIVEAIPNVVQLVDLTAKITSLFA